VAYAGAVIQSILREIRPAVAALWARSVDRLRRVPVWVWCAVVLPLSLALIVWIAWEQTPWARRAAVIARLEAHQADVLLSPGGVPPSIARWIEAPLKQVGLAVEMRDWRAFQDVVAIRLTGPGSARALRDLGACDELAALSANGSDVDDATLRSIALCRPLRWLYVAESLVTDRTLDVVSHLPNLEKLDVSDTDVTETGIRKLAGCHALHTLHLDGTRVSDDAVAALATLPNLQHLSLSRTRVTDASLQSLLKLKSLRTLWLTKSHVTTDGLIRFWRLRPDVDVDFDRWRPPGQM
jgi:hypothetical protein